MGPVYGYSHRDKPFGIYSDYSVPLYQSTKYTPVEGCGGTLLNNRWTRNLDSGYKRKGKTLSVVGDGLTVVTIRR